VRHFDAQLRLTLDLSHWIVVCERHIGVDGGAEQSWLETDILPKVNHVHARIGSCQAPQVVDPAVEDIVYFNRIWQMVWKSHVNAGRFVPTVCHEYGPEPYLPKDAALKLDDIILSEKNRLSTLFDSNLNLFL